MAVNNAINSPILGGLQTLTAHGVLLGEGTDSIVATTALSNGQLLIGSTGADPVPASLTAGANITLTPGAGSLTIAASATSAFSNVTGTTQIMVAGTSYLANNAGQVSFTLPTTAAVGTVMRIGSAGANTSGWTIIQNSGQSVQVGNAAPSTTGTGGSVTSTSSTGGDAIELVCTVANDNWVSVSVQGSLTIV